MAQPYSPCKRMANQGDVEQLVRAAREATVRYEAAVEEEATRRAERDRAILALAEATSLRRAAAELGITSGRVQQILNRARGLTARGA